MLAQPSKEIHYIEDTIGNKHGTVFITQIGDHNINTLFDTGATRSVMSVEMFNKLDNPSLVETGLPRVVSASGSSLGVIDRTRCEVRLNHKVIEQEFLVCEYLKRHLILGIDFARTNKAGVQWTKEGTRVLTIGDSRVCEAREHEQLKGAAIYLTQSIKIPPRMVATVEVDINTVSQDKIKMVPDQFCLLTKPNMYMTPLYADLATHKKGDKIPFCISNLSNEEYLYLPKDFVVGFAEKDTQEGETFEIACNDKDIEIDETPFKNWIPQSQQDKAGRSSRTEEEIQDSPIDLHKVFTNSNFIKSPAEVDKHRRVELKDQNISENTRKRFKELMKNMMTSSPRTVET